MDQNTGVTFGEAGRVVRRLKLDRLVVGVAGGLVGSGQPVGVGPIATGEEAQGRRGAAVVRERKRGQSKENEGGHE